MLTLWGRANSVNVQKVVWMLAELGIPYRRIDAGMKFGVNDTPEYKAMNPNGLIPTIDDDGYVLWESNVILRYLAAKHAAGTLHPADAADRFHAEQWMDWQATTLMPPINVVFLALIRTPPEKRDMAALEAAKAKAEAAFAILDAHLAGRAYMVGDTFTMADVALGTAANRWSRIPTERAPRPEVERWLAALAARPAFAEHLATPLS
jgi:glutathione S-transferase